MKLRALAVNNAAWPFLANRRKPDYAFGRARGIIAVNPAACPPP